MNNYDDIIDLKHFDPKNHPRMSKEKRAAQFAPFAALVGYEDLVKETARITSNKLILDEEEKLIISDKLTYLNNHLKDNLLVTITYFEKDKRKSGGTYKTITKTIKKIDDVYKTITFIDKDKINIDDIINIIY